MQTARPLVVDAVDLEGVTRFEPAQLLSYLNLGVSSAWPWGDDARYGPAFVRADTARVLALYAAYGHPRARVDAFEITPVDADDPEHVRVRLVIHEGPAIQVTAVDYPGGRPPAGVGPRVGQRFSVKALGEARDALLEALRARGHGYATVREAAEVDRDRLEAHLRFAVAPGPRLTVIGVDFAGLAAVPEDLARQELHFIDATPYSEALRQRVEQAIYGLDMFSTVVVRLPEPPPADGRVRLQIEVTERPPDDLKLGLGFGFSPNRWDEWASARYTHRNLFGRLTRLDLRIKAGWSQLPDPFDPVSDGPLVLVEPKLTRKGWLDPALQWTLAPAYELGIEQGYKFQSVRLRPGVSRFFFGGLRLAVNHTIEFFDFFDLDANLDGAVTRLGLDFADPYILSYLTLDARLHLTDDLFEPTNGVVLAARWDFAGGVFGGDFEFWRLEPEAAAYWRVTERLQLAARARIGLIKAPADSGAPFAMKLYLGGHRTVRGWGAKRLSPQAPDCADGDCKGIPIGGHTSMLANLEARLKVVGPIEVATFFDAGDVQTKEFEFNFAALNYASGLGLRVATPIGRFRLDLGFRLNDPARFEAEDRWALHLALGEAF